MNIELVVVGLVVSVVNSKNTVLNCNLRLSECGKDYLFVEKKFLSTDKSAC